MSVSSVSSTVSVASQAVGLQGAKRRIVFVGLYELIAIVASSLLFMAIGQGAGSSGAMAVVASIWKPIPLRAGLYQFPLV